MSQRAPLATRPETFTAQALGGAVLGPFEAWLLLRGMRTLFPRVRTASASALQLARHIEEHPAIAQVLYPGLPSHPQHLLAQRQFRGGYGAMLSLRLRGGEEAARRVAAGLRVFKRATSLGSVESVVEHRASVEGPGTFCPTDLLRLSIGIEHPNDLIADFEQALASALDTSATEASPTRT
jgi:cystathionine gamma-synthase